MQQITINEQRIVARNSSVSPVSNRGSCPLVSKVVHAVADFFRMIAYGIACVGLWLKDRVVGLLPESWAAALDTKRAFVRAILNVPVPQRAAVLENTFPHISPQLDQNAKNRLILTINSVNRLSVKGVLSSIPSALCSKQNIAIMKTVIALSTMNLPDAERWGIIRSAIPLITPRMSDAEKTLMARAVASLPAAEREAIVALARQVITQDMSVGSKREVLEAISALPAQEREGVIRNAVALMISQRLSSEDRLYMIRVVASVPRDERDTFVAAALHILRPTPGVSFGDSLERNAMQLITPRMRDAEKIHMLRVVVGLPAQERDRAVGLAFQSITQDMSAASREAIVDMIIDVPAVLQLPVYERHLVAGLARQIVAQQDMSAAVRRGVFEAAIALPELRRAELLRNAMQLMTPQMSDAEKIDMVRVLGEIVHEDRNAFVGAAHRLLTDVARRRGNTGGASTATQSAGNSGYAFIGRVEQHIAPWMSDAEIVYMMRSVARLPVFYRENVIADICERMAQDMSASSRREIIETMAVAIDHRLITSGMPRTSTRQIFAALTNDVPALEREGVARNVAQLVGYFDTAEDIIEFIRIVARIPAQERDAIVVLVRHHAGEGENAPFRRGLLEALALVPAQGREAVVAILTALTERWDNGQEKIRLLQTIARVPAQERNTLVALAREFITPNTDVSFKRRILEALTAVPVLERAGVTRNAMALIRPRDPAQNKVDIIRAIADLPVQERDPFVTLVPQMIGQEEFIERRMRVIEALAAVPAQERAGIVPHVIRLIGEILFPDVAALIREVAAVPAADRANLQGRREERQRLAPAAPPNIMNARLPRNVDAARGVNVHAGNRDTLTYEAIRLFCRQQGAIEMPRILEAVAEFRRYLEQGPHRNPQLDTENQNVEVAQRARRNIQLARRALFLPGEAEDHFDALFDEGNPRGRNLHVPGLAISGEELIGRLWIFALGLTGPEQTLAKEGMILALADSYEEGERVCNAGKMQRLVIRVLQGRLPGVNIERLEQVIQVPQAMEMFFANPRNQAIRELEPLRAAANQFCNENHAVDRAAFIRAIEEYVAAERALDAAL